MVNKKYALVFDAVLASSNNEWCSTNKLDKRCWTGNLEGIGELKGIKYSVCASRYPYLDIQSLTKEDATKIQYAEVWRHIKGDALPIPIAIAVLHFAIESSTKTSVSILQRSIGINATGIIDSNTIEAAQKKNALVSFLAARAMFYSSLSSHSKDGEERMRLLFNLYEQCLKHS